jgi:hypothetical protein
MRSLVLISDFAWYSFLLLFTILYTVGQKSIRQPDHIPSPFCLFGLVYATAKQSLRTHVLICGFAGCNIFVSIPFQIDYVLYRECAFCIAT